MLKDERRRRILELLAEGGSLSSHQVSQAFGVSHETIRKDLGWLEAEGKLRRTFGGALPLEDAPREAADPTLAYRNVANRPAKDAIARYAAGLIQPGDTVVLDSSTTTLQMVKHIPQNRDIVVVTNALATLNELAGREGIGVVALGGTYRARSTSFLGRMAAENLSHFNISRAFVSGNAFDAEAGLTDPNEQEAEIKRAMVAAARHACLLVDATKFGRMAAITTCAAGAFEAIITDGALPAAKAEALRAAGLPLVVV